jgi:peptidoglycan/LPS O-acetylase OafA/YrhL
LPNGWTLTVEAQFYVVAAAAIFLMPPRRDALRIAGWLALAVHLVVLLLIRAEAFNPVFFIPFFVLGSAIYRTRSDIGTAQDRWQAIVAFILTITCIETFGFHFGTPASAEPRNFLAVVREHAVIATSQMIVPWIAYYAALLGIFLALLRVRLTGWVRKLDVVAGDLTYPFYLVHIPVVSWMLYPSPIWSQPQYTFFVYIMCCVAAYGLHCAIERPMAALRRRIRDGVTTPAQARP